MTGDLPGKWERDSEQEKAEAHRAAEMDRLKRWMGEQKARPLTDLLGPPSGGESGFGPVFTPEWFGQVPEPRDQCWMCQRRGVPDPCPPCRAAREQGGDPASAWSWWAALPAADRRLLLAARWRVDPWTGRAVAVEAGWLQAGDDGRDITAGRHAFHPVTPSTAWDLIRRES